MKETRPVFLDLTKIRFPVMAMVSILHRISGVIIFLLLPLLLWALHQSLASQAAFQSLQTCLAHPLTKFFMWAVLASLLYHLVAGIRHIMMDFGHGDSLEGGRMGARTVMVVGIILVILAGVWLW